MPTTLQIKVWIRLYSGYQNTGTKDLAVRSWECPECGAFHDRDANTAKNILQEGAATAGINNAHGTVGHIGTSTLGEFM